jgi:hypothetical protein
MATTRAPAPPRPAPALEGELRRRDYEIFFADGMRALMEDRKSPSGVG